MVIADIINIGASILAIYSAWLAWKIYKKTAAKSMLLLLLAIIWGMVTRILIVCYALNPNYDFPSQIFVVGFWIMLPIGLYGLLRSLDKIYHKGGK